MTCQRACALDARRLGGIALEQIDYARRTRGYTRELAGAGGAGGGDLPGQVGAPGGSPGQYTHGSGDSSHECEVTPQLTCTCDGTPIIQVRVHERSFSSGTQ